MMHIDTIRKFRRKAGESIGCNDKRDKKHSDRVI